MRAARAVAAVAAAVVCVASVPALRRRVLRLSDTQVHRINQ